MVQQQSKEDQIAFYVLFGLIGTLVFWLIRSYLDTIALALMMVIVLKPTYDTREATAYETATKGNQL